MTRLDDVAWRRQYRCAGGSSGRFPAKDLLLAALHDITTAPEKSGVKYGIDAPNVTVEVALTGRMIVIEGWDDRFDGRFSTPDKAANQLAYFVPIIYLGQVAPVLATGSHKDQRQDALGMLEDLKPVLDHFAIALHHARLYRLIGERARQRRVAQKMEEMGQLTFGIAHNFNNLPQGVIGNLSLVVEECDEFQKAPLEDALRPSRSQAELVGQFMACARRGPKPEFTAIDIEQWLDAVTTMCRQVFDRGIEFQCDVAADVVVVAALLPEPVRPIEVSRTIRSTLDS